MPDPTHVLLPVVEPAEAYVSYSGHDVARWSAAGDPEISAYVYDGAPIVCISGVQRSPVAALDRAARLVSAALKACEMAGQREPADVLALPAPEQITDSVLGWTAKGQRGTVIEGYGVGSLSDAEALRTPAEARAIGLAYLAAAAWAENAAATGDDDSGGGS